MRLWQFIGSCIGYGTIIVATLMLLVDAVGPFVTFRRRERPTHNKRGR
jgi:hypothetical protein